MTSVISAVLLERDINGDAMCSLPLTPFRVAYNSPFVHVRLVVPQELALRRGKNADTLRVALRKPAVVPAVLQGGQGLGVQLHGQ